MRKLKALFIIATMSVLSLITACGIFSEVDTTTPSQFLTKLKAANSYTISMNMQFGEVNAVQTIRVDGEKYHYVVGDDEEELEFYEEKDGDIYYQYILDSQEKWEKREVDFGAEGMLFVYGNNSTLWESVFNSGKYTYDANKKGYTLKEGESVTFGEGESGEEGTIITDVTLSFSNSKVTVIFVADEDNSLKIEFSKLNATTVTLPVIDGGDIGDISQMKPSQFLQALRAVNSYTVISTEQTEDVTMTIAAKFSNGNYHITIAFDENAYDYYLEKDGDTYYYYELDSEEGWQKSEIDLNAPEAEANPYMFISNCNSVFYDSLFVDAKYNYNAAENKYTLKDGQQISFEIDEMEVVFTNSILTLAQTQVLSLIHI